MNVHSDDRRLAYFNVFDDATLGQVNIVRLHPGALCAWHRHAYQTDRYLCVVGTVKVGTVNNDGLTWYVLDEHLPTVVTIPPGTWHGYMPISGEAVLLQYLDRKYDPTDEERKSVEEMGVSWASASR
jgi:dTDP-4-dehydrorhamnose 3,5-epimerase-like enzyme